MYITTFFALKKVRDKRKIMSNNFLYLNKLEKIINKKGIKNIVINNKGIKKNNLPIKDKSNNNEKNIKFKNILNNLNFKYIKFIKEKFIKLINKFNIHNKFNFLEFNIFDIFNFFIFFVILFNIFPFLKLNSNIIHLATNIYVSPNYTFNVSDFSHIYPVFNESSYFLKDIKIEKVEKENKKEDVKKENINYTFNSNFENNKLIIDSLSNKDIEVFKFNNNLNVNIKKASNRDIISFDNIKINNYSSRKDINFKELYNRVVNLTKKSDKILLYNTHASESYKNSENYKFEYTGTYRTRDEKYNMLAIAKELQENLISKNVNVIHNTVGHDYYKYTGSYNKSRESIKNEFKLHKNFGIIMDIHRDACADLDFAPKVSIKGVKAAQIMLVLGVGSNSNRNKNADDNIALAIKIQNLGEKIYPRFI